MAPLMVTKPLGQYKQGDIFVPAKDAPVETWIRRAMCRYLTPEEEEAWKASQKKKTTDEHWTDPIEEKGSKVQGSEVKHLKVEKLKP